MRVKELKDELKSKGISTNDVFEKEELVMRLYEDRKKTAGKNNNSSTTSYYRKDNNNNVIEGDLIFTSMATAFNRKSIQTVDDVNTFPTVKIRVNDRFDLTLLLDTACSGFVLRPSIVREHGLKSYNKPITMSGAGGSINVGLTQLERFTYGGEEFDKLPAAIQDIGALPPALDGIIGLSFLNRFVCVEFDMLNGKLRLYKKDDQPPIPKGFEVAAEGEMTPTRAGGVYTVDVTLDGRGPIKMLVDSGASSSFLSWQGISDLGYTKSMLKELSSRSGVIGTDNVPMQLTHTLPVEIFINLGRQSKYYGVPINRSSNISIDVGNIPVLESKLKADQVVGILGMDLLRTIPLVRILFRSSSPKVTFLNNNASF
eukprot:CAMPEP_0194177900 /NCGR_PEP_ID=MMETSP0154-20130528/11601_1 /TAXON_ID=1049557 /ORGANISM="Thalassiothrix antarctica, Strain L6-D1" /LENGTH=370 /DNA_ID=CAMNT_0038892657 /DNA_START=99 /DNA_END=1211 /DNA_ORIENTATION=+